MTTIVAPATSANLGPGFDALGLALGRHLRLTLEPEGAAAEATHPATKAFRAAGGDGPIGVATDFPPGRGMGYSGAARVAGVVAAAVQRGDDWANDRRALCDLAADLEGHADNAAASMYGGCVVAAGDQVVRVPIGFDAEVVLWIPDRETSTRASRGTLPATVPFADAVFNLGRAALLVAAVTTGDTAALSAATEDRLHQDQRLAAVPESAVALAAARRAGAYGAWLSGSGPTVAALCSRGDHARAVADALPTAGARVEVVPIDLAGARVE